MFQPRKINTAPDWLDADGVKLYTVSASGADVDAGAYLPRLELVKAARPVDWGNTPSFAIFHDGVRLQFLVLAWWGNDNELFTSVSVRDADDWIEDPARHSFCLWDLEIFWAERNIFIATMYAGTPDLQAYRQQRFG